MESDTNYFVRRAREERDAARKAEHPAARQSHIEMAERFEELTGAIKRHQASLGERIKSRITR